MSAIAGVFSGKLDQVSPRLERIHQALHRRGETARVQVNGPLGLAFRTWDETAPAQPAHWSALRVVAHAAIYDRDEIERALGDAPPGVSDPELIARAYARWGDGCVSRIDGDFAFALWDGARQRLFCARDPLGLRPFFYRWDGTTLAWASEAQALAADSAYTKAPDEGMVGEYLLGWSHFPDTSATFYSGIRQLPGGHWLVLEGGQLRVGRYWDIGPAESNRRPFEESVREFGHLLERSTLRRASRPGPLAVQVSGGLDSTSVASLLERARQAGNGSLAAPRYVSYYIPHPRGDERSFARAFAEQFSAPVDFLTLGDLEVLTALEEIPDLPENPFLDLAWKHTLVQAQHLRDAGSRVVLTGLGGDNIFPDSGPAYFLDTARKHGWWRALQAYRRTCAYFGVSRRLLLGPTLRQVVPANLRRAMKRGLGRELPAWIRPEFARRSGLLERVRQPLPRLGFSTETQEQDYLELTSGRVGLMLGYFDRIAAAHGFEFRHPFFDPALISFTLLAPMEHKIRAGETKVLLRESMRGILPELVRQRRHKGTAQPFLVQAIRQREAARWEQTASDLRLCREYLKPEEVGRHVRSFLRGDNSALRTAWRLLSFELWLRNSFGR
jgi:asparagine synthase (glutamine-hydrolysing)